MKTSRTFMLLIIFPVLLSLNSYSQKKENDENFWRRVSIGGNFGFQFGTITGVLVSPEVRIRTVDHLYFGLGMSYQYIRYNDYFYNLASGEYDDFSMNVWGGRIFSRYYLASIFSNDILGNLFAHAEYEYLTYTLPYEPAVPGKGTIVDPYAYWYNPGKDVKEISSIFIGGGYQQPLGRRAFMDILILFNLNESYDSPYSNPIIRIGFGAGL